MPARRQIRSNDSRTPGPASLGPNMVPTQAVKYTASAARVCIGRHVSPLAALPWPVARARPPPGSSGDHSGSVSGIDQLAAQPVRTGDQAAGQLARRRSTRRTRRGWSRPSASRRAAQPFAARLARVVGPQPLHQVTGVDQHRAGGLAHAVDRAGVDRVVLVLLLAVDASSAASPLAAARCISRRSTIRCRGVVVRSLLGQTGSQ